MVAGAPGIQKANFRNVGSDFGWELSVRLAVFDLISDFKAANSHRVGVEFQIMAGSRQASA